MDDELKDVKNFLADEGENSGLVTLCRKMGALQREWPAVVGPVFARRSSVAEARASGDAIELTVNVADSASLKSIEFKKARIERAVKRFMNARSASVKFKVGKVERPKGANPPKEPQPDHKRRRPLRITDEEVADEAEKIASSGEPSDMAERLAALKVLAEKRAERKK